MAATDGVFLNVPYDKGYESLFVTLVGTLVFLGQEPRCVLEIREAGQGRLSRLYELLSGCSMSIHDLCRVGAPARLNMPFELGLACGLSLSGESHQVIVLEAKPYRLDKTLSDYKGRDPLVHHNRCDEMVSCLLDIFVSDEDLPTSTELRSGTKTLRSSVRKIKVEMASETIFRPSAYRSLVAAATEIAVQNSFIAP